jgi:hypothetical protein
MTKTSKFICTCGILHNTKAHAEVCKNTKHFKDLIEQGPQPEKDEYGTVLHYVTYKLVESMIGPVLVKEITPAVKKRNRKPKTDA